MALSVFISHSVGKDENRIVDGLSASLTGAGVPNYMAMHDREPGKRLTDKVRVHIDASKVLVALLTPKGDQASWVHDEIGYALGRGLRVVAFLEKGLKLDGMHEGAEYVSFDPNNPAADIAVLSERLAREQAEDDAKSARDQLASARASVDALEVVAVLAVCAAIIVLVILAARK